MQEQVAAPWWCSLARPSPLGFGCRHLPHRLLIHPQRPPDGPPAHPEHRHPSRLIPDRAMIVRAIDTLEAEGGTNISEGLILGYRQAHTSTIPSEALRVVLLMSDGRPNGGTTSHEELSRLALGAFQDGVQTSAFGLGTDYDGALMSSLASAGAGGYYYVSKPDQIGQALSTELDRRLDPVALGVEVRVRLKSDVKLLGV